MIEENHLIDGEPTRSTPKPAGNGPGKWLHPARNSKQQQPGEMEGDGTDLHTA